MSDIVKARYEAFGCSGQASKITASALPMAPDIQQENWIQYLIMNGRLSLPVPALLSSPVSTVFTVSMFITARKMRSTEDDALN